MNTQKIKELSNKLEELNNQMYNEIAKMRVVMFLSALIYPILTVNIMISWLFTFLFVSPFILFGTYVFIRNKTEKAEKFKEKIKQEIMNNKEMINSYFNNSISEENNTIIKKLEDNYKKENWNEISDLIINSTLKIK